MNLLLNYDRLAYLHYLNVMIALATFNKEVKVNITLCCTGVAQRDNNAVGVIKQKQLI